MTVIGLTIPGRATTRPPLKHSAEAAYSNLPRHRGIFGTTSPRAASIAMDAIRQERRRQSGDRPHFLRTPYLARAVPVEEDSGPKTVIPSVSSRSSGIGEFARNNPPPRRRPYAWNPPYDVASIATPIMARSALQTFLQLDASRAVPGPDESKTVNQSGAPRGTPRQGRRETIEVDARLVASGIENPNEQILRHCAKTGRQRGSGVLWQHQAHGPVGLIADGRRQIEPPNLIYSVGSKSDVWTERPNPNPDRLAPIRFRFNDAAPKLEVSGVTQTALEPLFHGR